MGWDQLGSGMPGFRPWVCAIKQDARGGGLVGAKIQKRPARAWFLPMKCRRPLGSIEGTWGFRSTDEGGWAGHWTNMWGRAGFAYLVTLSVLFFLPLSHSIVPLGGPSIHGLSWLQMVVEVEEEVVAT